MVIRYHTLVLICSAFAIMTAVCQQLVHGMVGCKNYEQAGT